MCALKVVGNSFQFCRISANLVRGPCEHMFVSTSNRSLPPRASGAARGTHDAAPGTWSASPGREGSSGSVRDRPGTASARRDAVRTEASILHADLDSFYASVEQRDNPRLRGRPVLVGGGVVLAASYEAKAHGVRTPMNVRAALRLCPHALVVPPRMAAYAQASRLVFEIFRDTTPEVEGISIDEAFLDVGGLRRIAGSPVDIATRLRARVREQAGLPISVGVARTKFLAKVARGPSGPARRTGSSSRTPRPRRAPGIRGSSATRARSSRSTHATDARSRHEGISY